MKKKAVLILALVLLCAVLTAPQSYAAPYKTKNVIVAVMDGVRYPETFGDPGRALIPNLAALEKEGTLFTNYRIAGSGISVTRQGHSTISTGTWQTVALSGARMTRPTFFEYGRNELGWKETDCYAIFGKGKYAYARYSSFPTYGEKYMPSFVMGIGEKEMPNDDAVLDRVFQAMDKDKPKLIFINFGVTDHLAHVSTFEDYQNAIKHCDEMFGKLWKKVQSTPGYKDETTVFYTNDHGRHTNKFRQPHNGFSSHGDQCDGCRHIMLLTVGPDIKKGAVVDAETQEIDICPTVGELLGFQTPFSDGKVLIGCLESPQGINKKEAKTAAAKEGVRINTLAQRDMVKTIADANLNRDIKSLKPSAETEILMRGMLEASATAKDDRYRKFVQSWVDNNRAAAANDHFVARVMLELATLDSSQNTDLSAVKECAKNAAASLSGPNQPAYDQNSAMKISFVARAAAYFKDDGLKEPVKKAFSVADSTEQQLVAAWRKLGVDNTPMACDVPTPAAKSAALSDTMNLIALTDAAAAMPMQRTVRLACDLQEAVCSQGRPELGANWKDPTQSALTLAALLDASAIKPAMNWAEAQQNNKQAAGKKKKNQLPRWANVMQVFYKDSIPWQTELLKFQVTPEGHFANGDPMSDGAALMLFASANTRPVQKGKLQTFSN